MKLKTLNENQKQKLKSNKEKFVNKFLKFEPIDKVSAKDAIEFVYSLIKKPMPKIYQASNPFQAQLLANKFMNTKNKFYSFGTYLTAYWAGWYSFYETFVDFGIITKDKFPKYFKLRKYIESNIFMTIEFDSAIIVVEKPLVCLKNEIGLHNLSGMAIQWRDGYGQYYINGRCMPKWIFEKTKSNTLTKEDFINEENEDIKAGIYELIESKGEGSMLDFLGASEVDKQTFVHSNGEIEEMTLYKTVEKFEMEEDLKGNSPAQLAWLKMSCPSTGTRYLIPSDGSFNNCVDAAKFHRPSEVPTEIEYKWNSRN